MGNPATDWIIPGIGAAANIIGGAISRGQQLRDFARDRKYFEQDREYNSPANQLRRIHEAGLPSAAYFGGSASSQAEMFNAPSTEADNRFGEAGESIGKYFSTRMERIQTETAQTNLDILKNQKKLSDLEVNDQLKIVPDAVFDKETNSDVITMMPRVIRNKRQKERMEDSRELAISLESKLKQIEHDVSSATTQEQIDIVKEKLDNIIEDTLGKHEDVLMKRTENKYKDSELQYRETLRTLRREFWGKLRTGKMPSFREILNILMLALENRL